MLTLRTCPPPTRYPTIPSLPFALATLALILQLLNPAAFGAAGISTPTRLEEAWSLCAQMDFEEAHKRFSDIPLPKADRPAARQILAGRAITGLNRPTSSQQRIASDVETLRQLHTEQPADETGIMASYYLGRAHHRFLSPQDRAQARLWYEQTLQLDPNGFFGQLAFLKLASIELHDPSVIDDPDTLNLLISHWIERSHRELASPIMRRNFMRLALQPILLYEGSLQLGLQAAQEAVRIGYERHDIQNLMTLKIVSMALDLGERETALEAGARFLANNPRHHLRNPIQDIMDALQAEADPPESPLSLP